MPQTRARPIALGQSGMRRFRSELRERNGFCSLANVSSKARTERRWVFVSYDQLTAKVGPLARLRPEEAGVVLIEAPLKAARRPYHKQKLLTVLTNLRHFALEQAARGVAVLHVLSQGNYEAALAPLVAALGPLTMMEAAERELRFELRELVRAGGLVVTPNETWLTTREQFMRHTGAKTPWRMDAFYKGVRRDSGWLMQGDKPVGGKFSFDAENREKWRGTPMPPAALEFAVDEITAEVVDLVNSQFARHPGRLHPEAVAATAEDASALWSHALSRCLPHFGPYEDAMSASQRDLFHSRVSASLNLSRLLAKDLVADVAKADLPLASQEGFIRQILGWREYVHHVHVETDGFRVLPAADNSQRRSAGKQEVLPLPGDAGFERWSKLSWPSTDQRRARAKDTDGGAQTSFLPARTPLPPAFWGARTGLRCFDSVIADVWEHAYGHHITRLMVISNIGQLLDVSPRDLADWFWVAYSDAYDWVVEPNVLAMSTFSVGELATTKPYISGAAYIDRMSDYCAGCAFDPKTSCPLTRLYWAYLARHEPTLRHNPRMMQPLSSLKKRSAEQRANDRESFERVKANLVAGQPIDTKG